MLNGEHAFNKLSGISFASVKTTLKNGHLMVKYMLRKIHSFFSTFFSPDVKTFWQKVVQNVQLFHFSLVFSSNSKTAFFSFLSLFLSFFPFFFFGLGNILPIVKYRKWLWGTYGKVERKLILVAWFNSNDHIEDSKFSIV